MYRGGKLEVTQDGAYVGFETTAELKRMILSDEREYLKFPLVVGKKWTGTHTQQVGSRRSTRSMEYAVTGSEGNVFVIVGNSTAPTPDGIISQERKIAYDPTQKSVVKFFYDSAINRTGGKIDIELLKFAPGGK